MEAKDFLKQIRKINILIENKQKEIDKLKALKVCSVVCGNQPIVKNSIETFENELNENIVALVDTKKKVQRVIDQIKEVDLVEVLYKRYFHFETWEQIALDKYCTFQWVHKLHAKSLKEVQAILEREGL